jgi:hypothetical protein
MVAKPISNVKIPMSNKVPNPKSEFELCALDFACLPAGRFDICALDFEVIFAYPTLTMPR